MRKDANLEAGTVAAALALSNLVQPPPTVSDLTNSSVWVFEVCAFRAGGTASEWILTATEVRSERNVTLEMDQVLRALAAPRSAQPLRLDDIADIRENSSLRVLGVRTATSLAGAAEFTSDVLDEHPDLAHALVAQDPKFANEPIPADDPSTTREDEEREPDAPDAAREDAADPTGP